MVNIRKITSYDDVEIGDLLNADHLVPKRLAVYRVVRVCERDFTSHSSDGLGSRHISGDELKNVILYRNNEDNGIEILAGENAYDLLTEKTSVAQRI